MKNKANTHQLKLRNMIRDIISQQLHHINQQNLNPQMLQPEYVRVNKQPLKPFNK